MKFIWRVKEFASKHKIEATFWFVEIIKIGVIFLTIVTTKRNSPMASRTAGSQIKLVNKGKPKLIMISINADCLKLNVSELQYYYAIFLSHVCHIV